MPDKLHSTQTRFLAGMIALPVVLYSIYRAYALSFTYDECWTYLGYATSDVWSVLTNANPAANNHVLHSLMMKCFAFLFGDSEFGLRLPALLGSLIYMRYAFGISKRLAKKAWWVPFVVLIYQPYLIDYFATARGYSLALGFTLGAIFYLDRFARKGHRAYLYWTLALSFLAAYSNFTYVLVQIAVLAALGFVLYMRQGLKNTLPLLAGYNLISALIFYLPISALIEAKELYYGGSEGFVSDTLGTLAGRTMYSLAEAPWLSFFFAGLMLLSLLWMIIDLGRGTWKKVGFWAVWVMLLTSFGSILQHYLLGSPFLIDRTAMFLLPLLTFPLFCPEE